MTMEVRTCIYLGALFLLHVGSADHGNEHTTQPPPERDLNLTSNLPPIIVPKNTNSTSSSGNGTTTEWEVAIATPQPTRGNTTDMEVISTTSIPESSTNLTNDVIPSASPTLTTQAAADTTSPQIPSNKTDINTTSHHSPGSLPVSTTPSSRTSPVETHPPTSPPLPRITSNNTPLTTQQSTTPTTTHTTTKILTTSSTSRTTTLTLLQMTSSESPLHTSIPPLGLTTTQTKLHPDTPSQLNVKGETVMVHDSPKLDPLLAGLVSAFIISAAVITLLLFLKLRRRDNRPEFRRLQDLPMDDMMEETPLSMYSY
ncbi:uncharacterized protein [Syngnathus scovelli]|uniref:uncharacterized protein n=1 Tax=Syngnathus scovelli TaxID=161590 RepID=UPI00211041E2|nr:uncharacterized protein LOC125973321 [Syngnathus scovelli]